MKNLKITLKWPYLKNEIDYETYKAAEISITEPAVKGEAQSDNTNADADFCRAKIDAAVGNINEVMHRFFLVSTYEDYDNTLTRDRVSWEIDLQYMDSERRKINTDALTQMCHRYVVAYVLAEWCKLALPSLVQSYESRMESEVQRIERLVNRKEAPTLDDVHEDETIYTFDGVAATIANVTTVGSSEKAAAIVNVDWITGSDGNKIPRFNFSFNIPCGATGAKGDQGEQGAQGVQGVKGDAGEWDVALVKKYITDEVEYQFNEYTGTKMEELESYLKEEVAAQDEKIGAIQTTVEGFGTRITKIESWLNTGNFSTYESLSAMILQYISDYGGGGGGSGTGDITRAEVLALLADYTPLSTFDTFKSTIASTYLTKAEFANYFKLDSNGNVYTEKNLYSTQGIAAYGATGTSGGGGGATALKGLTDVDSSLSPTDGQVLKYNATAGVWTAGDDNTGGGSSTIKISDYVAISGSGNAIVSAVLSSDGKTLTLTYGTISSSSQGSYTFSDGVKCDSANNVTADNAAIGAAINNNGTLTNYATQTDLQAVEAKIPSISGLATQAYVDDAISKAISGIKVPTSITICGQTVSLDGGSISADTIGSSLTKIGTSTVGSTTQPIYLNAGVPTVASTYAGGTAVTLNGESKAASAAGFYAPTTAGTSGMLLQSTGNGAPKWESTGDITVNSALKLNNKRNLWGQSFDGTADITGQLNHVSNIYFDRDATKYTEYYLGYDTPYSDDGAPAIVFASSNNDTFQIKMFEWNTGTRDGEILCYNSTTPDYLKVGRILNATQGIQIGSALLTWDSTNNALKISGNVYATGGVAAYGAIGSTSSAELTKLTATEIDATTAYINNLYIGSSTAYKISVGDGLMQFDSNGGFMFSNDVTVDSLLMASSLKIGDGSEISNVSTSTKKSATSTSQNLYVTIGDTEYMITMTKMS